MTGVAAGVRLEQGSTAGIERDIELVLSFLNTLDIDKGTDLLSDPREWRAWARAHQLDEAGDCCTARRTRAALREAIDTSPTALEALPAASLSVRFDSRAPVLAAPDAVSTVLAAAVRLVVLGQWERMKICPAHHCLWAFFDRSRNRSRTWCSMQVCGNREKARIWREKHT